MTTVDAERILDELAKLKRSVDRIARNQAAPPVSRLMSAAQVDRMYRMREGTTAVRCRAGDLAHIARKCRNGETFLIKPEDAAALFGAG